MTLAANGRRPTAIRVLALLLLAGVSCRPTSAADLSRSPHPPHPPHPPARVAHRAPLSRAALLGREMFFDPRLSGSGRMSCSTCHDPTRAYGPPNDRAVQLGGPAGRTQGMRAVPSLRYLDRVPNFGIGPDQPEAEHVNLTAAVRAAGAPRAAKTAGSIPGAPPMVPRGGLFWDGRVNTLQGQTLAPLFNPAEMANRDTASLATRLRAIYGRRLAELFGDQAIADRRRLIDEAMFTVARFEIEDSSFHPYSSKYDAYLAGRATLSPSELRGLRLFDDPRKGNCAACHLDRPGRDGSPPAFTDWQYEALGVPRNRALAQNRDRRFFDLGLCGPVRADLARDARFCGLFRTPSLRNVATRRVFFHNGVYHSLAQVLAFYAFRSTRPERIYPRTRSGRVELYDDLPPAYRGNVDTVDAPFDRRLGDAPALDQSEMSDIIAFLKTLTDGYAP